MLSAMPAGAAVINTALGAPAGPYNLGNPIGNIVPNKVNGFVVTRTVPNTYNFTFSVSPGLYDLHSQLSAFVNLKVGNVCCTLTAEPISYTLWFGVPSGPNSMLGTSSLGTTAALNLSNIAGGNYFMQINASNLVYPEEVVRGLIELSAVPEPATWGMMTLGVGMLGLAARRRRSLATA